MTPTISTDLRTADIILVNSSAGKDSQAMLDYLVELCRAQGVNLSKMVVVHCDLGRVEWKGTRELAERQAAHYGLRFEVVARDRDLLHQIEFERGNFPSNSARFCTSDQKTAQVNKLITKLVAELALGRPARILNCLGIRAQESPARAKKEPVSLDVKATNGKRIVTRWLPIFDWTIEQVWDRIRASGVEHHPAYDLGMSRLSCCFCVLARKSDLQIAAKHNPDLYQEYLAVEQRIGKTFSSKAKRPLSLRVIVEGDVDFAGEEGAECGA